MTPLFLGMLAIAASTSLTLFDGFENGHLGPFWKPGNSGAGRYAPNAINIQSEVVRSGRYSASITVHHGDVRQDGGDGHFTERAELDAGKMPLLNCDVWYGFSFLLPKNFPIIDNRLVIGQWKQEDAERPILSQRFRNGKFFLTLITDEGEKKFLVKQFKLRKWNDVIYNVKFSNGTDGYMIVWWNGKKIIDFHGRTATTKGSDVVYFTFGPYRDEWPESMTVYFDNFARGASYEEVDPTRR